MAGFSSGFDYGFSVAVGALARRPRLRWELFEVERQPARRSVYLAPLTAVEEAVEEPETEPEVLRGVPVLPRFRRLRPVDLEGYGEISIVGTGELTVGRAIAGAGPIILIAHADLEMDEERTAVMLLLGVPDA